jgi:hypothetical protein
MNFGVSFLGGMQGSHVLLKNNAAESFAGQCKMLLFV